MYPGCPNMTMISGCSVNDDPCTPCSELVVPSLVLTLQMEGRHTIMLSSSCAADLRPFGRLLFSAIDISEGVFALEFALETLLEGAILPHAGGIHPRAAAKRKLILIVC